MNKVKLLILDDEPRILTSLADLFEDDYGVLTTIDPVTALRLVQEHDIAVVLTDERMPGFSGHLFLQQVKEISQATRLMISGYVDLNALKKAVNSGQIFAYVAKPWDPEELKALVAAAVVHFNLLGTISRERELLRILMESIPDAIYFKDAESRFTTINREHARALGAKNPEECVGKRDSDYLEPGYASRSYQDEQKIVQSGQPRIEQVEKLSKADGSCRWMSTTKVPIFGKNGLVSGIAGVSRDITGMKNIEESLREKSEHNRLIIETALDAFIGMDADGCITTWNRQAELTFGWAAQEVMGLSLADTIVPPAHRQAHGEGLQRFLKTGEGPVLNKRIEIEAVHRSGLEFPVELMVWPARVGGTYRFNAFVRDITERRRAEEARKKETSFMQLLQTVTVAANESSTIERAAQICLDRICVYTGWPVGHLFLLAGDSENELISAGLWHVEQNGRFTAFREASKGRFGSGAGLPGRVLATGKPEWIVDTGSSNLLRAREAAQAGIRSGCGFPILVNEKVLGVLEFFSLRAIQPDEEFVTLMAHIGSQLGQVIARQRAEEDLNRAKQSAESASRAKSEFLTVMSHEIRTPMNAILGMAFLLSQTSLSPEQHDYVRIFQGAGTNLLDLINSILDLSKVESGRVELESVDFDLGEILEKTSEIMRPRAHAKGLHLTCEVLPDVPLRLAGDPDRLRQILINLLANALKFTGRGYVRLRVERDPASAQPGLLRFSVSDSGIGIASGKLEMIFARFTQADSSTTREYGGTGLGLAICKGLVELMGGQIGCTSELGTGSTFFFTAPFQLQSERLLPQPTRALETTEPSGPPASGVAPPLSVTRILIAEDSDDNLFLIKAYLKGQAFELDVAVNGRQAVEKVLAGAYDLVLMDVQMPLMDGYTATRAIRQWENQKQSPPLPILALTAHASKEEMGKSKEAGCTAHLTKPISKATLLEAISPFVATKLRITPAEGIAPLIPKYLENVRRNLDEILAGIRSSDYQLAQTLGHQLKGSGAGYGFPEITRTGAAIELAARNKHEEEIRNQILALAIYLDRVEIAVPED